MPMSRWLAGTVGDVPAVDDHPADGGLVEPGEDPQRGGLAAAGRAEQRDQLAGAQGQVEPVEGLGSLP